MYETPSGTSRCDGTSFSKSDSSMPAASNRRSGMSANDCPISNSYLTTIQLAPLSRNSIQTYAANKRDFVCCVSITRDQVNKTPLIKAFFVQLFFSFVSGAGQKKRVSRFFSWNSFFLQPPFFIFPNEQIKIQGLFPNSLYPRRGLTGTYNYDKFSVNHPPPPKT